MDFFKQFTVSKKLALGFGVIIIGIIGATTDCIAVGGELV